jgi:tRNA threonylcarbamoyladenosine dehydratase
VLEAGYPLVSSMGSGGKTDPALVRVDDIDKSYNCRLAAILRKRLHRMGIRTGFKVVYSAQQADKSSVVEVTGEANKKSTVGTISYMPPLFGCYCASVVINDLIA